ncbi:excisionase family DNA-binding protein [Nonomuraea sp. NPDC050383]|uniref:excisionase family DNA-binding protein n=1 Tax=Nonomuraea sp. NPDC050383 TaxID=3364362 RepID=UPI00379C802F
METVETVQSTETVEAAPRTPRSQLFMAVADAAEELGLSKEYLYSGLRKGELPGAKFGRNRKILRAFVEGFKALAARGVSLDFEEYAASWLPREDAEVAV